MNKVAACCLISTALVCSLAATAEANNSSSAKADWQLAEETEVWTPEPPVVSFNERNIPSDAQVLFDGKSLDQWESAKGGDAKWNIRNGVLVVAPKMGDIRTRDSFCDVQLHIEWMAPNNITDDTGKIMESQARSNSGVFLQEKYEVQVLDSYQNKTYSNGQAGAIYKQSIPLVNATRAPGMWQTYDIIFNAPKFDTNQKLVTPGYITVLHNGVLVQNHFQIQGRTTWIGKPGYTAHGCAPLRLQEHGNPLSFRNIWIRKL